MKMDQHISFLLHDHSCVIVPDFGGFVGNYRPAKLDRVQHRLSPPGKEISFNRNLTNNDGLLANRIATADSKSFEAAMSDIRTYVAALNANLRNGDKVEVEQVGVLYLDEHRNIRFEPDRSVNYNRDSFGMAAFHATKIKREPARVAPTPEPVAVVTAPVPIAAPAPAPQPAPVQRKPAPELQPPVAQPEPEEKKKKRRAIAYWPHALLLVLLIGYLVWVPSRSGYFRDRGLAVADFNPFLDICPAYSERETGFNSVPAPDDAALDFLSIPDSVLTVQISFFDEDEPYYDPAGLVTVRLRDQPVAAVNTFVETSAPKALQKYHVIGGCFQYLENAEGLVSQLRAEGFGAYIFDKHRGLYRVAFDSFATRREALDSLATIKRTKNKGAWLLVRTPG